MESKTYDVSTLKSVEEAIQAVEESLKSRRFSVLWHLDVNQKLVEKGLEPEQPFHVLEVCSAPRAKEAIHTSQKLGYFLPCKVVVYQDKDSGQTRIGFPEPESLLGLAGSGSLSGLAREVADTLREAVDEAATGG